MESARQQWSTPQVVFNQLHSEYAFTVDAAAQADNAKLLKYWTLTDSGLTHSWADERVFCNPPWNDLMSWIQKALTARFACVLIPSRTDTAWYELAASKAELHFFRGRLAFKAAGSVKSSSNPYATGLMLFGEGVVPGRIRFRSAKTGILL